MSVKTDKILKNTIMLLLLIVLSANSLLLKNSQKRINKSQKTLKLSSSSSHLRNSSNHHTKQIERKLLLKETGRSVPKSRFTTKNDNINSKPGRKLVPTTIQAQNIPKIPKTESKPNGDIAKQKSSHPVERLLTDGSQVISLVLIAAVVFLIAQAPMWGLMIFALPIFLEILSTILGLKSGRTLRKLKPELRNLKKSSKNNVNEELIALEEKKIVLYMNKNHFKLGPDTTEPQMFNIIGKYLKDEYHMKERTYTKKLNDILDALYKNKDQIIDKITQAL